MFIIFCLHLYCMRLRVRVMLDFSFSLFESGHTYTYECRSVGFGWYSRTSYVKQKSNKNNTISSALGISLKMALFVCGVLSCWWNVSFFLFFRISLSTKTVFLIFLLPLPLPLSPPLSLSFSFTRFPSISFSLTLSFIFLLLYSFLSRFLISFAYTTSPQPFPCHGPFLICRSFSFFNVFLARHTTWKRGNTQTLDWLKKHITLVCFQAQNSARSIESESKQTNLLHISIENTPFNIGASVNVFIGCTCIVGEMYSSGFHFMWM